MATTRARSVLIPGIPALVTWAVLAGALACGGIRKGKGVAVERLDAAAADAMAGAAGGSPGATGGSGGAVGGSAGAAPGTGGAGLGGSPAGAGGAGGTPSADATLGGTTDTVLIDPTDVPLAEVSGSDAALDSSATPVPPAPVPPPPPVNPVPPPPPPGPDPTPPPPPPPPGPVPPPPGPGLCGARICPAVSALLAACQPSGSCWVALEGGGTRACYQSGVEVSTVFDRATGDLRVRVTRPDGQNPCYEVQLGDFLSDGARLLLFRDGVGKTLSRGVLRADGRVVLTCEGGTTEPLAPECVPLAPPGLCRPGACR